MDAILGSIQKFTGTVIPAGFAACNGQLIPISQNLPLYSIIGTKYGGDGTTTFALPNLPATKSANGTEEQSIIAITGIFK